MQDFRNLSVWRKAHELTLMVYRLTRQFPREEMFGLKSQLRRAGYSIGANIAEGCGRSTDADFGRFLWMSVGSASELDYGLLLAHDLGYISHESYSELGEATDEVQKMLSGLISSLRLP